MAVNRELSDRLVKVLDDVANSCDQISTLMQHQKALIKLIRDQVQETGDVTEVQAYMHSFELMLQQEAEQTKTIFDQIHRLNSALTTAR